MPLLPVSLLLLAAAPHLPVAQGSKVPVVKWGQKPDRVYLTIPLPEVEEPNVEFNENGVRFSGQSRGQDYDIDLILLRGIVAENSTHVVNKWSVTMEMPKARSEPCWKRLLKTKETFTWLKKDHDRWYAQECQHAKEEWRQTYFEAKLDKRSPNDSGDGASASSPSSPAMPAGFGGGASVPGDEQKKQEQENWERVTKTFRDKAVPRTDAEGQKRRRRKADRSKL
uniref:CS domain-containing protein n=1 Tax=Zooxanthella nutricula TaxID=1333877 RepID=A0A6V0I2Q4_9DINO